MAMVYYETVNGWGNTKNGNGSYGGANGYLNLHKNIPAKFCPRAKPIPFFDYLTRGLLKDLPMQACNIRRGQSDRCWVGSDLIIAS